MLIRISLIVAILAALAVGTLNFIQVKAKIDVLKANLDTETKGRQKAEQELARTKSDLNKRTAELKQTQDNLTTATEAKNKAVADLEVANKKNSQLTEDLARTKTERDAFQAEVSAYKLVFPTTQEATAAGKQIKQLQDAIAAAEGENVLLTKKAKKLEYDLSKYIGNARPVLLPPTLHGKILVFDPKWDFVVLNIGEDQGVLMDGELLVSRDGKLVAKIIVRTVEKDRSIANIVPGWKVGELLEGDLVVPAHPQS